MLFIGSMAVMLFTFPWLTLTAMSIAYYAVLPISAYAWLAFETGLIIPLESRCRAWCHANQTRREGRSAWRANNRANAT